MNHLSALSDQFLVHVIPMDGLSLIVPDDLSGRSLLLRGQMSFCLRKVCQKMVCRCEVHEIPKDGQSLIVLDDPMVALNGRSFLLPMVDQFLKCVIPKGGQNEMLAYAHLWNLSLENLNEVQNHVSHLNALGDQFLEHVIPTDGQSSNVPVCLKCGQSGRSFLLRGLMSFALRMVCQKKVCRCAVREIPKDGQS